MKSLSLEFILFIIIFKISNNNEITIKIRGNGDQKILSDNFENELPDDIIINGNIESYTNNVINLVEEYNNVTLRWNENQLTNCKNMFRGLTNIIEFNFSKFDCSKIIDMSTLCPCLISI